MPERQYLPTPQNRAWAAFVLLVILSAAAMLPRLELWPPVWQDEVQILELGRAGLDPDTDWGMGWLVEQSKTRATSSISIEAAQELAYQLTAPSNFGSRFVAFLGAVLAAGAALGWLLGRRVPPLPAVALATVFLLDPIFNESYRQGRIDGWAFVFVLVPCWLLRLAKLRFGVANVGLSLLFAAGAVTGCAPSVWPTTYALMPLIALELAYVLYEVWHRRQNHALRKLLIYSLAFLAGASLTYVALHLEVLTNWDQWVSGLPTKDRVQQAAAAIQRNIIDMYALYDPIIGMAVVASLLIRRELGLLLALAVSLVMMYQTMMYPMRILYLLPYFVAVIGGACATVALGRDKPRRQAILIGFLALLLFWNIGVSLVQRPIIAHFQQDARSQDHIRETLESAIGGGPYRVLLEEWDMYFAARFLGWKIYKVYGPVRRNSSEFREFLDGMDYVIQRNKFSFLVLSDQQLEAAGFLQIAKLSFIQPSATEIPLGPFKVRAPGIVYEDIVVYQKVRKQGSTVAAPTAGPDRG